MSSPFTEDGTLYEQCPKCGAPWEGDCPDNPAWLEWHCGECGYCEGQFYDDERCVLVEGDPGKQNHNPMPRKEPHP